MSVAVCDVQVQLAGRLQARKGDEDGAQKIRNLYVMVG